METEIVGFRFTVNFVLIMGKPKYVPNEKLSPPERFSGRVLTINVFGSMVWL